MKQYFVKEAYSDNYLIVRIVDGEIEHSRIISWYEFSGYISLLKDMGYKEAYYLPNLEKIIKEKKEELNCALDRLEEAKKNPLVLSERAEKEFKRRLYYCELEDDKDEENI